MVNKVLYRWSWILGVFVLILMYKFIDRDSLMGFIRRSLPPGGASILNGMLWGDKSGFTKEFSQELNRSGLVHLVVVSGTNVILVSETILNLMAGFWGRKKTTVMVLVLMWGYAFLTGLEVPVLRAGILLSVKYLAVLYGRKYNLIRGIIFSLGLMTLVDFGFWTSISFWLSWMAFLGVVTAPKKSAWVRSLWVTAWITPLLSFFFGQISLVSPLSNLLVMGMTEGITVVGMMGSILGLVWSKLGAGLLWVLVPWLSAFEEIVERGGKLPVWEFEFNYWMVVGWYLLFWGFLWRRRRRIWELN